MGAHRDHCKKLMKWLHQSFNTLHRNGCYHHVTPGGRGIHMPSAFTFWGDTMRAGQFHISVSSRTKTVSRWLLRFRAIQGCWATVFCSMSQERTTSWMRTHYQTWHKSVILRSNCARWRSRKMGIGVRTSILFLDTKGFESVEKSNVCDDRIFALANNHEFCSHLPSAWNSPWS